MKNQRKMMNEIIVALDGMSLGRALDIANQLKGKVWGFKVNDLLVEWGTSVVVNLQSYGNVMVDLKLYDIPNTVNNSVARLAAAGAHIITVHASGGIRMMKAAKDAAGGSKIFAVTLLTSLAEDDVGFIYKDNAALDMVVTSAAAGVDGVVCSAELVRKINLPLLKCVPGVRLGGKLEGDDQKTVADEKVKADYLVIGRPITQAETPLKALQEIRNKLNT